MWKYLVVASVLTVGLFMQACAPQAQEDCGFVTNVYGERISWKGRTPIPLYIHSSVPNEYMGAIENAVKAWEQAAGKRLFELRGRVGGGATPAQDGYNVIYWMNTWENDKLSEQARTNLYWVGDQISEADIRVNNYKYDFYWNAAVDYSAVNIEALIIHELGHVLGLKHQDNAGSVMDTYLSSNSDRVYLSPKDVESLQCEY